MYCHTITDNSGILTLSQEIINRKRSGSGLHIAQKGINKPDMTTSAIVNTTLAGF